MLDLTKENFDAEVLAPDAGLVFVDFWSPQCAPCLGLMPDIEAFAAKNIGRVKLYKLDISANKRLSYAQKVLGLPALAFYQNGKKVFEFYKDAIDMDKVQAKLEELLS